MIGASKHLMANPKHLLIDDNARNCQKFSDAGGLAILFPQRWNECYDYTGDKCAYIISRIIGYLHVRGSYAT
jgi:hypothetical protein